MTHPVPLLHVEDLRVHFREGERQTDVLHGVSFSLFPGETLGIVGESGSGKTMTALAVSGLLPPGAMSSCRSLRWLSRKNGMLDLGAMRENDFSAIRGGEIGFVFQEPGTCLNPVWPCGEQIAEVLRRHQSLSGAAARNRAMEWIERVKLPDPARIYRAFPHELSGGQKQRVMIAAALCTAPQLLIADEPTTALDATVQLHILRIIRELKAELDIAVLFISHDLNLVGQIADRVMVMRHGQIVEENTAQELFDSPRHEYTRALLHCRPGLGDPPVRLPVAAFSGVLEEGAVPVYSTPVLRPRQAQRTDTPALTVENLRVRFPLSRKGVFRPRNWLHALDGIDFSMYEGETLGVVGESGSGKTTLGRTLLGLVFPQEGAVTFQGQELLKAGRQDWQQFRKRLQIIFQDPFAALNPRQRIGEALLEPMRYHGIGTDEPEREARLLKLLDQVGLSRKYLQRFPHELSGGQRQRVSIARAMAVGPSFLICDEAVSSLDVSVQAMVLNLLKDLQNEYRMTYLFISHDLAVVNFMSDRILVMKDGRVVEMGAAAQVLRHPQQDYTRALIAAAEFRF